MDSSFRIPDRHQLHNQLERSNRWAAPLLMLQAGVALWLTYQLDWKQVVESPLVMLVGLGMMVGPTLMGILMFWAQKKKEVDDLKDSTRFGEFDKYKLRRLFQDTLQRLGLPDERLPLYITADRSLNASSLHLGLGRFFKSLNGVYLNRQLLHRLTPQEVQDTMGHELGHYYEYYLIGDRFRGLTLLLAGLLALFATQSLGMESTASAIFLMFLASCFWWLSGLPNARHAQAIEYLCDDLGSRVGGIMPAINNLMKLGVSYEAEFAVQHQAMLSHRDKLSVQDMADVLQTAIPYGYASRVELETAVDRALRQKRAERDSISLRGFLSHVWNADVDGDEEDALDEFLAQAQKVRSMARLPWESLLSDPQSIEFDADSLPKLIALIEDRPQEQLFRFPEVNVASDGVHPPLKHRILYLWYNREAIEAERT